MSKQTYEIKIVAEAGTNPFTGASMPELSELFTVEAGTLEEARRLAPVYMHIKAYGRLVRFFHNGTELLGNF